MSAPTIGEQGREKVRRMACRRWGVTVQEVQEALEVSYDAARRFLLKLVKESVLTRSGERRRRTEIFEKVRGAGGFVYRTTRRASLPKDTEWYGARSWRSKARRIRKHG